MVSIQRVLAGLSVLIVAALGLWGWSVDPEHPGRWAFFVFFLPAFWAFVEVFQGGEKRERIMGWHRAVVAAVGLIMAMKVGFQLAIVTGTLDADWWPIARRVSGVLLGAFLAVWGNFLPKLLSPWSREEEWFDWQRVHRFVGWMASLIGVVLVIVWLTAPLPWAKLATTGILVTFVVLVIGRKFVSVAAYSRRPPPTTGQD